jgi:DegV family protein with EDD domain
MLISPTLEPLIIRSALDHLGDSMVIAGSSRRLRIHIHTDDPEEVFRLAAQFGDVHSTKADDMHGQAKSLVRKNKGVAIVTDSAADLPAELIKELDIHVVPLRVTFGSKSYLDKISLNPAQFLAELQRNPAPPGTSQPTQGDLRRMYEFLLTHFTEVLSINLSSKLSGTYQAACLAASAVSGSGRIRILDSANVSVGQGLIVKRAGELAAAGITGTALWTVVQEEISSMRTFALVTDLSNAVRSGRLKPVLKQVTDLLHLTPVLMNTRSGKVGVHGFIPGRFRLTKRFARYIARTMGAAGKWEVAIASSTPGSPDVELLQAELAAQLKGISAIWQTDIGPALGVHIGMTGLVVAIRKLN